jgi:hypothetical protein
MNKNRFGIPEITISLAIVGMIAIIAVRIFNPDLFSLSFSFIDNRLLFILLGVFLTLASIWQFKIARLDDKPGLNKVMAHIRVILNVVLALACFYLALIGGLNA